MKRIIPCAAAIFAMHAQAAIVTIEYTTPITRVKATTSQGVSYVQSAEWAGFQIRVGDTITHRFSYDDAYIGGSTTELTQSLRLDQSGASVPINPFGLFYQDWTSNTSAVYGHTQSPLPFSEALGSFDGPPGPQLEYLPQAHDWLSMKGTDFYWYLASPNPALGEPMLEVYGAAFTPHLVSVVPEPAACWQALAGLALLGAAWHRRRKPLAA